MSTPAQPWANDPIEPWHGDPIESATEKPPQPTKVGPLASYLQEHFPNVAHYLGVTNPTPQEDAEFQRNISEFHEITNAHPILWGTAKALFNDATPAPDAISMGAPPPGLLSKAAGALKNAAMSDFASSNLGKLVLPYRWHMAAEVAQDIFGKESAEGSPALDAMAQRMGYKDFASAGDAQGTISQLAKARLPSKAPPMIDRSGPVPTGEAAAPPRTIQQEMEAYLAKQRGEGGIVPANVPPNVPESPAIRGPVRPPIGDANRSGTAGIASGPPSVSYNPHGDPVILDLRNSRTASGPSFPGESAYSPQPEPVPAALSPEDISLESGRNTSGHSDISGKPLTSEVPQSGNREPARSNVSHEQTNTETPGEFIKSQIAPIRGVPREPSGTVIVSPRTTTGAETLAKALLDDGITADQAKLLKSEEIAHYGEFTPGDRMRAQKLMEGYETMKNASPEQIERLKKAGALDIATQLSQSLGGK